jgi:predicted nucleic acid-binding protein
MADRLILETTFLIDLERERSGKGGAGPCARFLELHFSDSLYLTHIAAGELACGVGATGREQWERQTSHFHVLEHTKEVDWHYAQTFRYLHRRGELIPANDLWIAATGLAYGMPVVARNVTHFERVPGLVVFGY